MTSQIAGCAPDRAALTQLIWFHGVTHDAAILTLDGEMPIGALRIGSRVITRDRGAVTLRAMTRKTFTCGAVRIRAGSLGHMRPERDVVLPEDQPLLVRDWRAKAVFGTDQAVVPVRRLVDGEFVTVDGPRRFETCSLGFDKVHVLYVGGLEMVAQSRIVQAEPLISVG